MKLSQQFDPKEPAPRLWRLGLSLFLVMGTGLLQAQEATDSAMARCREIPETAARAACYDAIMDTQKNQGQISPETQSILQENQRLREEMARRRKAGADDNRAGPTELVDRIAALETGPNGWIITLKNGQIWRQSINKRYHLQNGQQVRIYPTIWGESYRLSAEGNGAFIQVKRIR